MRTSAAELREIAEIFAAHEQRLDDGDEKLHEHDEHFARTYQEIETLKNEVLILRDGMSAYCDRVIGCFDRALAKIGALPLQPRPGPNGETPRRR